MHEQARGYVASVVDGVTFGTVVEVGGRDLNGGVRDLFVCDRYVSVDLFDGPGVDVVADASQWDPDGPVDCVVACEVFEHTPDWPAIVDRAWKWLVEDGWLIVTCATGSRPPHSGRHAGPIEDGEWYANVDRNDLFRVADRYGFAVTDIRTRTSPDDLYMTARKDV